MLGSNRADEREVLIKPRAHALASLGLGAGLYAIHPDPMPAATAICTGTLMDLDHLYDLWKYQEHRRPGERLLEVFDAHTWVKSFIFFHALELIPFFLILIPYAPDPWIAAGFFLGYTTHLVMDVWGNRCYPLTYFLTYRFYRKFDARFLWTDACPRNLQVE